LSKTPKIAQVVWSITAACRTSTCHLPMTVGGQGVSRTVGLSRAAIATTERKEIGRLVRQMALNTNAALIVTPPIGNANILVIIIRIN